MKGLFTGFKNTLGKPLEIVMDSETHNNKPFLFHQLCYGRG